MKDWEKAPMDEVVCYCSNVTKAGIINAIAKGAKTIKQVAEKTQAGIGAECAVKNPSGMCCHGDIQNLLDLYVEAVRKMQCG